MSLTKSSPAYHRAMDELFEQENRDRVDNSDQEYQEYLYLQALKKKRDPKTDIPADDVQPGEQDS